MTRTNPEPTQSGSTRVREVPAGLDHQPPAMAAPYEYHGSREQRWTLRELAALLKDSLFERVGSNESNTSAVWGGPLGWAVEYGYIGDRERLWARIYHGDRLYAETLDATYSWLDATLP